MFLFPFLAKSQVSPLLIQQNIDNYKIKSSANYGFMVSKNGLAADGSSVVDWTKAQWTSAFIPSGSTATVSSPVASNGGVYVNCNNVKLYNTSAIKLTGIAPIGATIDLSNASNQKLSFKAKSSSPISFVIDMDNDKYVSYFDWGPNRPVVSIPGDNIYRWYTFDLNGKFTSTPSAVIQVAFNYISNTSFSGELWIDEILLGEYVPTISKTGNLSNFVANVNTPSKAQGLVVTGNSLIDIINVYAPSGYEITNDTLGSWSSELQLSGLNSKLFIRTKSQAVPSSITGNLTLTSVGAVSVNIPLNGSIVNSVDGDDWQEGIQLLSNPVHEYLEIIPLQNEIHSFTIYSSLGEIVLTNSSWNENEKIDIKELPSGLYMICFSNKKNIKIVKFIKD